MKINNFKVLKTALKAFPIVLFILAGMIANGYANGDWQKKLEPYFDIVSTFDDLNDWKGNRPANTVDIQNFPNEFPVKTSTGEPSIWQYYSIYENVGTDNWIQYHGAENTWRGKGKSMCLDYTDGADGKNRGPGRFGFKIGDSPNDGYDNLHLFFMTKWLKDFFKFENGKSDSFAYHRFLKTLDISAGFKTVRHWGTDAEHNWVASRGAKGQALYEYGLNAQVYNYTSYNGPSRKEVVKRGVLVTNNAGYGYENTEKPYPSAVVKDSILLDQWFGIEYRVKKSNPHGAANGEIEIWVYDQNGNQLGHQLDTGIITFKDGNSVFNHKWNKFVWGGNRYAGSYCPGGDPLCDFGPIDHFYIDDVIVDGSRIGPSYFDLVKGNTPVTVSVPNPKNLRVLQ